MAKFFYAYHGGKRPETPEAGMEMMSRWNSWLDSLGAAAVDRGNPVGMSKTVSASGVVDNGGSNPLSGFSIVEADSIETAVELSKGCPHLDHGSIEIAEIMDM
ncbi:MAG: YciI family protein [Pseudomonadota bacterium]